MTGSTQDTRPVHRVVFPVRDADETLPLYAIGDGLRIEDRTSVVVPAGSTLDLGTYFNSFPACYWRHWTDETTVVLRVRIDVSAVVAVYASDETGAARLVASEAGTAHAIVLPIDDSFADGGYYWFTVTAPQDAAARVSAAQWTIDAPAAAPGTISIGITTFNRPGYCLDQLARIAAESELRPLLDTVYVVDQGTQTVDAEPGYRQVAADLGERLRRIPQANLGGSGGFTRAMFETLRAGTAGYVLLLDDDAISEPESILRAIHFADAAARRAPVLVGGAMFHLDARTTMFVQGEEINLDEGRPRTLPGVGYDNDFAAVPLARARALHRRHDAGYNGWWMTLIPRAVLTRLGLGLPYFLKWDDMEFGLRCARAGIPTVSLPGVAVWHQAWHDKFSWRGWEEFFAERNMWHTMLTYEPTPRRVPLRSFLVDVGMLLSLQYSSVALRIAARNEAAHGLSRLHGELGTRLASVRALRARYPDAALRPDASAYPLITHPQRLPGRPGDPRRRALELSGIRDLLLAGLTLLRHLLWPVSGPSRRAPRLVLDAHEAIWRQFLHTDSALVEYPGGVAWLKRNRRLSWRLLLASLVSVRRLRARWPEYHARNIAEHPDAVSPVAWETTFAGAGDAARPQR